MTIATVADAVLLAAGTVWTFWTTVPSILPRAVMVATAGAVVAVAWFSAEQVFASADAAGPGVEYRVDSLEGAWCGGFNHSLPRVADSIASRGPAEANFVEIMSDFDLCLEIATMDGPFDGLAPTYDTAFAQGCATSLITADFLDEGGSILQAPDTESEWLVASQERHLAECQSLLFQLSIRGVAYAMTPDGLCSLEGDRPDVDLVAC